MDRRIVKPNPNRWQVLSEKTTFSGTTLVVVVVAVRDVHFILPMISDRRHSSMLSFYHCIKTETTNLTAQKNVVEQHEVTVNAHTRSLLQARTSECIMGILVPYCFL